MSEGRDPCVAVDSNALLFLAWGFPTPRLVVVVVLVVVGVVVVVGRDGAHKLVPAMRRIPGGRPSKI